MSTTEACRIPGRTDVRAAARPVMELAPEHAAALLTALSDGKLAAEVLTYTTSQTVVAVVRADRGFGRAILPHLTEPLQTEVSRALADAS